MTRLPRGSCPVCYADVALRNGALVREHRGHLCRCGHPLGAHHRFRYNCMTLGCPCTHDEPAVCRGSGEHNSCKCFACQTAGVAREGAS